MKRRMVLKRRMAARVKPLVAIKREIARWWVAQRIKHSVMVNPFRGKPIQPFKWRED